MIRLQKYKSIHEKREFLAKLDPAQTTYLVADLAAKEQIQNYWLKDRGYLAEDSVLRAQEFWIKQLKMTEPSLQFVSQAFMSSLLDDWLQTQKQAMLIFPGTARLLSQYIQVFLPLFSSSELTSNAFEWLQKNPLSLTRWGAWFFLAHQAWQHLCKEKVITALWAAGYLSQSEAAMRWNRNVVFDVDVQLKGMEVQLIQQLAQTLDPANSVEVLVPDQNQEALAVYNLIVEQKPSLDKESQPINCQRYATELSEVKAAVAWLRKHLDQGVSPQDLSLLMPDVEHYWPCLVAYFAKEGIPVVKSEVAHLSSFPAVMKWLARLRLLSRQITTGDIEALLFEKNSVPLISFSDFQQLFSQVYSEIDLQRSLATKKMYERSLLIKDKLNRDEFVLLALKEWPNEEMPSDLERIMASILLECPQQYQLSFKHWLRYTENLIAKSEIRIRAGRSEGVIVGNLESAYQVSSSYVFVLGVAQSYLNQHTELSITATDVQMLAQDLGVYLEGPATKANEWALQWLMNTERNTTLLTFAETDFSGEPLSPSRLWVEQASRQEQDVTKVLFPEPTRWDEVQKNMRQIAAGTETLKSIDEDRGVGTLAAISLNKEIAFSASQFEKYRNCPFQFAAEKIFGLRDVAVVDFDVDRMTGGRILHEILRELTLVPWRSNWNDNEILQIIDLVYENISAVTSKNISIKAETWPVRRLEYLRIAQKFIQFENNWRKQFPTTQSLYLEHRFDAHWKVSDDKSVRVRGQMDRIDRDEADHLVILDYKSGGSFNHATSWVKNNNIQLLFYAVLIEEGVIAEVQGQVVGAFYYVLSQMNRSKGFRLDNTEKFLPSDAGGKKAFSDEKKQEIFQEVRDILVEVVNKVDAGLFAPKPEDKKICTTCRWRLLCRAPHLN